MKSRLGLAGLTRPSCDALRRKKTKRKETHEITRHLPNQIVGYIYKNKDEYLKK